VNGMRIQGEILEEDFLKRLNRFLVRVRLVNETIGTAECYLPNPGRLRELLVPGAHVLLIKKGSCTRRTAFDLFIVYQGDIPVCIDSRVPNQLVFESISRKRIPELLGFTSVRREPVLGKSRLDFLLTSSGRCYLEVKSCTLVRDGLALFPDAPTKRGCKHLKELVRAKKMGERACILFVVQRDDDKGFMPNDDMDPDFGHALREAKDKGVEIYAYSSRYRAGVLELTRRIPVEL